MTEPLVVDPSRLKAAGTTLQDLAVPAPPAPTSLPGADPVSAAINETLPVVESPVIKGLPAIEAAVTRTGSSIVSAARIYAETDQALGAHVGKTEFLAPGEEQAGHVWTDPPVGATTDQPTPDESSGTPEPTLTVEQMPASPDRTAEIVGAMGPVTQNAQTVMSTVQGAMGGMGGMGNTSASTAQTADDAAMADQSPADQTELVDETSKSDDAGRQPEVAGAATGGQASETAPVHPPAGRRATGPPPTSR